MYLHHQQTGILSQTLFQPENLTQFFGQTTLSVSDNFRIISGLRYSEDKFSADITNFFNVQEYDLEGESDEVTSRVVAEFDFTDDIMVYFALAKGYKPGGSNLTFGFTEEEDIEAGRPVAPAMVFPTFESETVDSVEFGLKSTFADGRARANVAVFSYDYENLQFQATDDEIKKAFDEYFNDLYDDDEVLRRWLVPL